MAYYILKSYELKFPGVRLFEILNKEKGCFFLDSSLNNSLQGRYSFLGIEPFFIFNSQQKDCFKQLKENLKEYNASFPSNRINFWAGAVGYLAYDLGFKLENKIKTRGKNETGIPGCFFGFYNTIVIIDHYKQLFHILSLGYPEKKEHFAKILAESNFKKICKIIAKINFNQPGKKKIIPQTKDLNSDFTKAEYIQAVRKAKEYIKAGDIYQVNLSQQFSAKSVLGADEIYERLRYISPSSFGAYFDAGDFQIISSSPERFLRLGKDNVITKPMKGTRPRAKNKSEDRKLKQALIKSAKDKAELTMIVDLERNDLGKVCGYGTVKVRALRELEEYETVFQTTATIEGRMHKDKDRIDLLRACFPGGSVSGCPKIRAMEIIEELEPARRGIYTGCLGYLSFSGGMDFNILIRTILKKGDNLYFGAGGGIVADSKPEDEYEETLVKAEGILRAINARMSKE